MRNLLFKICYDGSRYHGYQVQQNALAIMEVVQNAIEEFLGVREPIVGCSRTDSGVHALEYYFHMKTNSNRPCRAFVFGLNRLLPNDIAVLECREVPLDFHARYHAQGKEYLYYVWNAPVRSPFQEGRALHVPKPLDISLLDREAKDFVGTHDFAAFCSSGSKIKDTVRTIHWFNVSSKDNLVQFSVAGNGFLYNMVRIMVGTLLKISEGGISAGSIPEILQSRDRKLAGRTAPAHGLYLNHVFYPEEGSDGGNETAGHE